MHLRFFAYGKWEKVETLFRDMRAQKHWAHATKGEQKGGTWIEAQLRMLPFGIMEYIFIKEDLPVVLNTLAFALHDYELSGFQKWLLKKISMSDPLPEVKPDPTKPRYLWILDDVNIILIGIKEDPMLIYPEGHPLAGWKHEAI